MIIPSAIDGRRIWLIVGTLLDGICTQPRRNAHIVYDGSRILHVGENSPPADLLNPGMHRPDLELPEYTLLPGLIDAHAHFFLEGGELNLERRLAHLKHTSEELLSLALVRLEKLVRLGVIAVRDAGDKDGVGLALSKLNAGANRPLMPYVDSPGSAIHHHRRYGSFMAEPIENFASPRQCVENRVKAGADRIKLITTGVIDFKFCAVTSKPQMTTEEICELVAAAKVFGKQTFAHASGDEGIERTIDAGVDSIEHGFFVRTDQLAKMRDRQIAWVPTFAPVQKQINYANIMGWDAQVVSNLKRILDHHASALVAAREMGVPIIAGSDAGSYGVKHGVGLFDELESMERAGIPPVAVINSATGSSSNRLAFKENFGQIKSGFLSRFILTRHSPSRSVTNLRKDRFVIFDGAVFESKENPDSVGL